jgi:hypothetical protein
MTTWRIQDQRCLSEVHGGEVTGVYRAAEKNNKPLNVIPEPVRVVQGKSRSELRGARRLTMSAESPEPSRRV